MKKIIKFIKWIFIKEFHYQCGIDWAIEPPEGVNEDLSTQRIKEDNNIQENK